MKSKSDSSNPLIKQIHQWKKDQGIISLSLDEMKKTAKGKKVIVEQKVDGQSAILDYKEGQEPRLGSLGGVIIWDLPLLEDIEKIFKSKNITQTRMVGELAGYDGKIIPFNESESLIKNPKADKTKVHWFPYQILELNGEKYGNDFESYMKSWPEILRIFKSSKYVHPVESTDSIDEGWDKFVEKQKNEGIVVRTSDNKIYKVKPLYSYDLVIIAVGDKKGKNWPKKMIGTTLMAFMDNNHVFRTAGEIGTGLTHEQAKELYSWAQKNKVGEDDHYVWVKPKKIVECVWERSHLKNMPAYKYSKGKYEKVDKLPSGTIVKPRFIRYRTDKSVTPGDLRLTQIPDWGKKEKMARIIVTKHLAADIPAFLKKATTINLPKTIESQTWSGDNGIEYNVNKIVKIVDGNPIVQKPVKMLVEKNKDLGTDEGDLGYNLKNFDAESEFGKRSMKSDLNYPVFISEKDDIIDGAHRLAKAFHLGHPSVKAIVVTQEQLNKTKESMTYRIMARTVVSMYLKGFYDA